MSREISYQVRIIVNLNDDEDATELTNTAMERVIAAAVSWEVAPGKVDPFVSVRSERLDK